MIAQYQRRFKDWIFDKVHHNQLIYNSCWEDPNCDQQLLNLDQNSEVVMITSAGCNALHYNLSSPKAIHCIDLNHRQNALLDLKLAIFKQSDYAKLFQLFGKGQFNQVNRYYQQYLRSELGYDSVLFWDEKIEHYFEGTGLRQTFYFHGTAGTFAYLFHLYLKINPKLATQIEFLLASKTMEEQKFRYEAVEKILLGPFVCWLIQQHFMLNLLGIPPAQSQLVKQKYKGGIIRFIKESLRQVFTTLPLESNYFWQVYLRGFYTHTCCPEYLKPENFEQLKNGVDRINLHHMDIGQFLKDNPTAYSHFVLLDHQDWLSENNKNLLEEEWRLILKNSRVGTKILLRSGSENIEFFPSFIQNHLQFDEERCRQIHAQDRVGTYGSVYLGTVHRPLTN